MVLEEGSVATHNGYEGNAGFGREKRLVAYLVGQQDTKLTSAELRAYLHQRLPDYMIPAFYVQLNALPLLPNGKVDRRGLSALSQALTSPRQREEGENHATR